MSLPKMATDVDNISKLDTRPNAVNGLTADQLKAEFDKGPAAIKAFLNNVLIPALDSAFTLDALGGVPKTREINGKALSEDITLTADDIAADDMEAKHSTVQMALDMVAKKLQNAANAAVPKTRKVAGKTLDADVTLNAKDVHYTGIIDGTAYPDVQKAIDALKNRSADNVAYSGTVDGTEVTDVAAALDGLEARKTVVIVTLTISEGVISADKSISEIFAAYSAGKSVVAHFDDAEIPATRIWNSKAEFRYWQGTSYQTTLSGEVVNGVDVWSTKDTTLNAANILYGGEIGGVTAGNVAIALSALAIGNPLDMTEDYAASGASSVQQWATMAASGSTAEYRAQEGRYRIKEDRFVYDTAIVNTPDSTYRQIIVLTYDTGAIFDIAAYFASAPNGEPTLAFDLSTEEKALYFNNSWKNCLIPQYDGIPDGYVLTMRDGAPDWKLGSAPEPSSSDNGKILTVKNGMAEWADLPTYTGGVS